MLSRWCGGLSFALGLFACATDPNDPSADAESDSGSTSTADGTNEHATTQADADGEDPHGDGSSDSGDELPSMDPADPAPRPIRRLSRREIDQTLQDIFDEPVPMAMTHLPAEAPGRYDNDTERQSTSSAFVQGVMLMAESTLVWLDANPVAHARLLGCDPQQVSWQCVDVFVPRFGRRLLRRPLLPEETAALVAAAGEDPSPRHVADTAVVALLQDPEFLYQLEVGEFREDTSHVELTAWELAARLAFSLWGRGPDEHTLDWAAAHDNPSQQEIEELVGEMLGDPRAREHALDHHAMWLGFANAPVPPQLRGDMLAETRALVERVSFVDDTPWASLLDAADTLLTPELAEHYEVPWPGGEDSRWLSDPSGRRRGIAGHGTMLAQGSKFGDTSPTTRGRMILDRLLCAQLSAPPGTNVDVPPEAGENACKPGRYETLRQEGCAHCHELLDPIGLGLEHFDATGRWREHEAERPDCAIEAGGEVAGLGKFDSPAELGALLRGAPAVRRCAVTNVYMFALGREALGPGDEKMIEQIDASIDPLDYRYQDILFELVTRPEFRRTRGGSP